LSTYSHVFYSTQHGTYEVYIAYANDKHKNSAKAKGAFTGNDSGARTTRTNPRYQASDPKQISNTCKHFRETGIFSAHIGDHHPDAAHLFSNNLANHILQFAP
jgi:hypothetical protein